MHQIHGMPRNGLQHLHVPAVSGSTPLQCPYLGTARIHCTWNEWQIVARSYSQNR